MSPVGLRAGLAAMMLAGCWSPVSEIVTPHVEPGGTISASLGSGTPLTTKALADGTAQPMTVIGNSAELVFGLIVGNDATTGMPGKTLLLAGTPVQLTVAAGSQLSVHLAGASCATTAATVNLKPDGKGHLDGDFSGTGASCTTSGTLSGVPIDQ